MSENPPQSDHKPGPGKSRSAAIAAISLLVTALCVGSLFVQERKERERRRAAAMEPLEAGDAAPDFTLGSAEKKPVKLSNLLKQSEVFLWFYQPG